MHTPRAALLIALLLAICAAPSVFGVSFAGWRTVPTVPTVFAQAEGGVESDSSAQVQFGEEIRFVLRAQSAAPIRSVQLLYQVDDSIVQNSGVPVFQPGSSVTATYTWRVAGVLVPGAEVRYRWKIETADGATVTTPEQTLAYNDTRFTWMQAQSDGLTVYFPSGNPQMGATLLDEATKTRAKLSQDYGLTLDKPLRIFAYVTQQDYVTALASGRVADAATTIGTDRIFVLAPTGTSGMTEAAKGLRREVINALFLQKTQNPYADPPQWLAEGFGLFMSGQQLSQNNAQVLGRIAQANRLLPLKTLNGAFPTDQNEQALAYVESLSVVGFIMDTYGAEKMKALLASFKEGSAVDDAVKKGLGVSFDQLETRWKKSLKGGAGGRTSGSQRSSPQPERQGFVDRLLGPATDYWQKVFGASTQLVLIGLAGFVSLAVLAVVGGSVYSIWRRGHTDD